MDSGLTALILKVRALARSVWKRRWLAVAVAWPVALVCGVVISLVPDRFEASARIYVDTQTVLKPLMAGLAYQPDIEQQVKMLARTVVSRPNVERLVAMPALGLASADPREQEQAVNQLMTRIKVEPAGSGNLYAISYRDPDPARAQKLVEATLDLFVNAGSGGKRQDSEEASRFIDEQIKSYEAKLIEAENRLKDFKVRNFGVSGVSNQDYFGRMSALADEVGKLKVELGAAQRSRDAYRRELSAEDPQLPAGAMGNGASVAPSETDQRLETQRRQLDDLQRRFTDEHPDVVNTRRSIARLEAQKQQELARARAGARSGGMAATSPVYQRIRVALAEAEAEVASLSSQLGEQQKRLDEVRAMAGRVPQVEAELAQLNRDYDIIRKNYDQLVSRRESASLGVKLDETSHLADFRVVEPPRTSPTPIFPGRLALAGLAVLLTLAAAILAPIVADMLRPTVDDTQALRALSGRPVLGSVSVSMTDAGSHLARDDLKRLGYAVASLGMVQLVWVGWVAWATFSRVPA
jgi:polysaccharide chain length determinant protein (PEP-CTERM system associated)